MKLRWRWKGKELGEKPVFCLEGRCSLWMEWTVELRDNRGLGEISPEQSISSPTKRVSFRVMKLRVSE